MQDIKTNNEFIEEEFKTTTDDELLSNYKESPVVYNAVQTYLKEIGKYKLLSKEEFNDLFIKYKNGDSAAGKKIIEANLRLVPYIIRTNNYISSKEEFLDLIQEGNIGLMIALSKYDTSYGTNFSTYAYKWVFSKVRRNTNFSEEKIRMPNGFRELYFKYKKYINNYFKDKGVYPSNDEIKKELKINDAKLERLIEAQNSITNLASLNIAVSDDSDSHELEDFIPAEESGYKDFHDKLSELSLFYKLKSELSKKEYYILYYRIYVPKKVTLNELAERLGSYYTEVRRIESKVLRIAKKVLNEGIKDNYNIKEEDIRPIPFQKRVILLYLKDLLLPYEYYILYHIWYKDISKTNSSFIFNNQEEITKVYKNILDRFNINSKAFYYEALQEVLKHMDSNDIFNADITPSNTYLSNLKETIYNLSYNEILNILGDVYFNMNEKEQELIDHFFNPDITTIYPNIIERALKIPNLSYAGYYSKDIKKYLPTRILYQTYLKYKDSFTKDVQEAFETNLFRAYTKSTEEVQRYNAIYWAIQRLETLYYNLDRPFELLIPKEELLSIINDPNNNFKDKAKELLKLKFIDEVSIKDIAVMYNMRPDKVRDYIWDNYETAFNISLNKRVKVKISDEDRYYEYIMDDRYFFTDQAREICRLFFIEHKDYEYIKNIFKISKTRISNIITDAIHKMDFYYYGITYDDVLPNYKEELILPVLKKKIISATEKELIKKRYINLIPLYTLSKEYNIPYEELRNLMDYFNEQYKLFYLKYEPTVSDICDEFETPSFDSVLNEEDRIFISLYYGIKSEYNPEGIKHTKESIKTILNLNENKFFKIKYRIPPKVAKHKLGFTKTKFDLFTREELITILKDPHLPLSDFEIDIIKEVKGINTKPMEYTDVAKKHNINSPGSILRRIYRAFVTIKKYQANEIEPKISYEIDVVPYLRYFSKYEQTVLYQRFKLQWTLSDFMEYYHLTKDKSLTLFTKIENKFFYMSKYPDAKKFDFDYARTVIPNEDLPFYGNKEVIVDAYTRYFGDNGNPPENTNEIIFATNCTNSSILFYIKRLMLAVLKYRDGYRKAKIFSIEDILSCYAHTKNDMNQITKRSFKKTIAIHEGDKEIYKDYGIPDTVSYEILKFKKLLHYNLNTPKEEIENLLIQNPYNLTSHQLDVIRQAFNIPRRFLMGGKEKIKLFKLLEPYILKYEYELHKTHEEAIEAARKLDESKRVIKEDTTVDIKTQSIEFLTKSNDSVLVVDQNLEYIYAYIINHVKHIDFLSKDELLKLQYMLQEYIILNNSREEAVKILTGNLTKRKLDMMPDLDPYIKTYFEELVSLKNPNILYKLDLPLNEYIRRHFVLLAQDNYFLKGRIKVSNVRFIDEIQDKYQEINLGRTINYNLDTCTQEDILHYMEHLNDNGILIADFSFENAEQTDSLFNGLKHDTIPVKNRFNHKKNDIMIKVKKE